MPTKVASEEISAYSRQASNIHRARVAMRTIASEHTVILNWIATPTAAMHVVPAVQPAANRHFLGLRGVFFYVASDFLVLKFDHTALHSPANVMLCSLSSIRCYLLVCRIELYCIPYGTGTGVYTYRRSLKKFSLLKTLGSAVFNLLPHT